MLAAALPAAAVPAPPPPFPWPEPIQASAPAPVLLLLLLLLMLVLAPATDPLPPAAASGAVEPLEGALAAAAPAGIGAVAPRSAPLAAALAAIPDAGTAAGAGGEPPAAAVSWLTAKNTSSPGDRMSVRAAACGSGRRLGPDTSTREAGPAPGTAAAAAAAAAAGSRVASASQHWKRRSRTVAPGPSLATCVLVGVSRRAQDVCCGPVSTPGYTPRSQRDNHHNNINRLATLVKAGSPSQWM